MANRGSAGHPIIWTRDKVIAALQLVIAESKAPLPCRDSLYNAMKKGRRDLPCAHVVMGYFGSMGRAWLAAGAPGRRVSLKNIAWLPEEDDYLRTYAGQRSLKRIARSLHRTFYGVKSRLNKDLKLRAKDNQGFLSAAQLARDYNCSYSRIRHALEDGKIPGAYHPLHHKWQVNPREFTPEIVAFLQAPKRSHKTWPTDVGDYDSRHNLRRKIIDGRIVRLPA